MNKIFYSSNLGYLVYPPNKKFKIMCARFKSQFILFQQFFNNLYFRALYLLINFAVQIFGENMLRWKNNFLLKAPILYYLNFCIFRKLNLCWSQKLLYLYFAVLYQIVFAFQVERYTDSSYLVWIVHIYVHKLSNAIKFS